MSQKSLRTREIKDILGKQKIGTQEDLLNILKRRGFDITQATLSRDLKTLNVGWRNSADFGRHYFIPKENHETVSDEPVALYGAVSLEFSSNLCVIKTLGGYANSVGALIDNRHFSEIIGTVAGNDAILIILKEGYDKIGFIYKLDKAFTNLRELM
jgi:transcriptional regulator of arginine metabolism